LHEKSAACDHKAQICYLSLHKPLPYHSTHQTLVFIQDFVHLILSSSDFKKSIWDSK
jgi:hypothetical protein